MVSTTHFSADGKVKCHKCKKICGPANGIFCNRCDRWVCNSCKASGGICKGGC